MPMHYRAVGCMVSHDMAPTWSRGYGGVERVYPSLAVFGDGLRVISYGRPGAMLVFSHDGLLGLNGRGGAFTGASAREFRCEEDSGSRDRNGLRVREQRIDTNLYQCECVWEYTS